MLSRRRARVGRRAGRGEDRRRPGAEATMQRQNAVRWGASLIVFSLTGCGAGEPADDDAPTEHVLTRFDTLIAPATGRIGVVSDLWLAGDGRLWVADRVDHRVVALDADGRELLSL